jgi:hypothetical protein
MTFRDNHFRGFNPRYTYFPMISLVCFIGHIAKVPLNLVIKYALYYMKNIANWIYSTRKRYANVCSLVSFWLHLK